MSVTSQALQICILPSMEGNMLGIVYWFLCSLCKGEQIWTDNCTPKKRGANLYSLQGNSYYSVHTSFNRPGKYMSQGTKKAGNEHAKTDFWLVRSAYLPFSEKYWANSGLVHTLPRDKWKVRYSKSKAMEVSCAYHQNRHFSNSQLGK